MPRDGGWSAAHHSAVVPGEKDGLKVGGVAAAASGGGVNFPCSEGGNNRRRNMMGYCYSTTRNKQHTVEERNEKEISSEMISKETQLT